MPQCTMRKNGFGKTLEVSMNYVAIDKICI